nr:capsule biosynthesis protein [uncultured Celeribacter sp.]
MTTKVKARKFRVKRYALTAAASAPVTHASLKRSSRPTPQPDNQLFNNSASADGFGARPFPGSAAADQAAAPKRRSGHAQGVAAQALRSDAEASAPLTATDTAVDEDRITAEIDAIRREGLTGRQLRAARRVAQQHNLEATSDFDAVRLLRQKGINPFQKGSVLDLVSTRKAAANTGEAANTAPAASAPAAPQAEAGTPSPAVLAQISRDGAISQIQQDIARRRRRKLLLLAARLLVFVGIPTMLAGYYFYNIATPMYATNSSFVIQQAESGGGSAGGLGGLLAGSGLSSSQDSITVQDYLTSRDAMLRLDADAGFKDHFSSPQIDPIQRLPENPSNEQAYKVYLERVSIGYDPTEGLLRMEVVAANPQTSQQFSELLIQYAEEQVDHLTQRLREDQMKGARDSLDDAEAKMRASQEKVVELQEQLGIISPDAETSTIMNQVSGFETQLQEKRLQLQQLLDNPQPNQARVDGVRGDIRRLEALIADLRAQLTETQGSSGSLARISVDLRMAEADLATRQAMAQQALQSLEAARIEANRQVRYLSLSSRPVAPDEPTYPRKFESTLLSLLVFAGIYLMASLTAAVLREQVSA